MGQAQVLSILENCSEPLTSMQIEKKYKKLYGILGVSSIGHSLSCLIKSKFVKRLPVKTQRLTYIYWINNEE